MADIHTWKWHTHPLAFLLQSLLGAVGMKEMGQVRPEVGKFFLKRSSSNHASSAGRWNVSPSHSSSSCLPEKAATTWYASRHDHTAPKGHQQSEQAKAAGSVLAPEYLRLSATYQTGNSPIFVARVPELLQPRDFSEVTKLNAEGPAHGCPSCVLLSASARTADRPEVGIAHRARHPCIHRHHPPAMPPSGGSFSSSK